MAETSFVVIGTRGANIRRVEADTLAVSSLPDVAKGVAGIKVFASDDIWVGHYSLNFGDKAELSHYDGSSWTLYEVSDTITNPFGGGLGWRVTSIFKTTDTEEIFAVGACHNRPVYLMKWSGTAWSTVQTFSSGQRLPKINNDATSTSMWSDGFRASVQHEIGHWNGSSVVESSTIVLPQSIVGRTLYGVAKRNDGTIVASIVNNTPRQRTGVNTWASLFARTSAGSNDDGGNSIWHDSESDETWFMTTNGVTKWDGSTDTFYTIPGFSVGVSDLVGVKREVSGSITTQLWFTSGGGASSIRVGEPKYDSWQTISLDGAAGEDSFVDAFQGSPAPPLPVSSCGVGLINKEDGYTLTHYECLPDQHRDVNSGGGVLSAPFSLGNRFMHIRRK
jgi:hypothetical protein